MFPYESNVHCCHRSGVKQVFFGPSALVSRPPELPEHYRARFCLRLNEMLVFQQMYLP